MSSGGANVPWFPGRPQLPIRWAFVAIAASLFAALAVLGWRYTAATPSLPDKVVQDYLWALRRGRMDEALAFWAGPTPSLVVGDRLSQALAGYKDDLQFEAQAVSYFLRDREDPLPPGATAAALRADRVILIGNLYLGGAPYRVAFHLEDPNRDAGSWWLYKAWKISRVDGLDWLKPVPATP